MPNLAPLQADLLKHLGVSLLETWEVDGWGDPVDALHVFADRTVVDQVLQYFDKDFHGMSVRIFEGPPPPF